jgi:hypothetical protein
MLTMKPERLHLLEAQPQPIAICGKSYWPTSQGPSTGPEKEC